MSIMDNLHAMTSLVRTSVEEAARFGRLGAAVDHLLLALPLTDTPAGQLLRTQGAAYDATLAAMRDAEQDALESIGVTPPAELLPAEPTTTDGFTERAHRVFKKAKNVRPDYLAILESLLSEPSGTITTILSRLGTSAEELRTGIASVDVTQYQHKEAAPISQLTLVLPPHVPRRRAQQLSPSSSTISAIRRTPQCGSQASKGARSPPTRELNSGQPRRPARERDHEETARSASSGKQARMRASAGVSNQ